MRRCCVFLGLILEGARLSLSARLAHSTAPWDSSTFRTPVHSHKQHSTPLRSAPSCLCDCHPFANPLSVQIWCVLKEGVCCAICPHMLSSVGTRVALFALVLFATTVIIYDGAGASVCRTAFRSGGES